LKKNTFLTILITALTTCLITNTVRDILYVKNSPVVTQKINTVLNKIGCSVAIFIVFIIFYLAFFNSSDANIMHCHTLITGISAADLIPWRVV